MKTTTHIRRFANMKILKNVTKNTKKSAPTKMSRSLTTKRSRFPRKFVIFKSTIVFLEAVLTQTFIPETLDSVPQAITLDTLLTITLDTHLLANEILGHSTTHNSGFRTSGHFSI